MTDLGNLPGFSSSQANAINSSGQIVGNDQTASGVGHAFLYSGEGMIDLNTLIRTDSGWTLEDAKGINDNGQIVGYGTNPSGQTDAYLLTPVPEPGTGAFLALGATAVLLFSHWGRGFRVLIRHKAQRC
jgi:probable HAF family extracellular repeat protein